MVAREAVHRLEYDAFLFFCGLRDLSNINSQPVTHHKTFLQRWATISDSGSGLVPPLRKRSVKVFRDSSSGLPSGGG